MLLGAGAAIPIGPINLLIIHQALSSYRRAVAIGLGAMSADIAYLLMLLAGLHWVLAPAWMRPVSLAGAVMLLLFALYSWPRAADRQSTAAAPTGRYQSLFPYLKGLLLTAGNPYTILFWMSVSLATPGAGEPSAVIAGLISAILVWVFLLPLIVHRTRHRLSAKLTRYLSIVSSLLLMFFAARLIGFAVGA